MQVALESLRTSIQSSAGKYAGKGKQQGLENLFSALASELGRSQVQNQRVMDLARQIIAYEPSSIKAVNQFLQTPPLAKLMAGGNFSL